VILLCEPNVSEGRDTASIDALTEAVRSAGVELVHSSADPDHNRMVLAYRGLPDAVVEATTRLATEAFARIDLTRHEGQHPRIGALDVVPFVAERHEPDRHAAALEACRAFGARVGAGGVPVFYYEDAATAPHRCPLPAVRSGGFEGLADKMASDKWRPDEGPSLPHPAAGAVIAGVRPPLVRFNVNLADPDVETARAIASAIRASSGGLTGVRALGLTLSHRGLTQVTMNLTDYHTTSLARVYEEVATRAFAVGVGIVGTEVIGPIPRAALAGVGADILDDLDPNQILEPAEDETG